MCRTVIRRSVFALTCSVWLAACSTANPVPPLQSPVVTYLPVQPFATIESTPTATPQPSATPEPALAAVSRDALPELTHALLLVGNGQLLRWQGRRAENLLGIGAITSVTADSIIAVAEPDKLIVTGFAQTPDAERLIVTIKHDTSNYFALFSDDATNAANFCGGTVRGAATRVP